METVQRGAIKSIAVAMEDRHGGRKHITRVAHCESFSIDPAELAGLLQRKFKVYRTLTANVFLSSHLHFCLPRQNPPGPPSLQAWRVLLCLNMRMGRVWPYPYTHLKLACKSMPAHLLKWSILSCLLSAHQANVCSMSQLTVGCVQTSASVQKLPGKQETGKEIALQGDLLHDIPKFLTDMYGLSPQYIDVKSKGK